MPRAVVVMIQMKGSIMMERGSWLCFQTFIFFSLIRLIAMIVRPPSICIDICSI